MATPPLSSFLWVIILFGFSGFLCPYAHEGRETAESHHLLHTHTVQVDSLIPSTTCTSTASNQGPRSKASLKVMHKYGPCFESNKDEVAVPNHIEILLQDQSRVNSIHSRISKNSGSSKFRDSQATTLPAKSGLPLGSGNYVVSIGLGTPIRDLRLVFDTGSDLTWTQCEPCAGYCYNQVDPIFDPSKSTSYSSITCASPSCSLLASATGNRPPCPSPTSQCVYRIRYGDGSYSTGYFSKERLTITPSNLLDDFLFGCGQDNQGLFKGIAGLLGLGRNRISIVQQAAQKYGQFFSYCLPSTPSSTGYLTFGNDNGGVSNNVKFTPLLTLSQHASFYGLGLTGISVGGQQLSIPMSVFSATGTIIDSGTVITRLPPMAYNELRTTFRKLMSGYPMTSSDSLLDTCYDFRKNNTVSIPKIGFLFGGLRVDLDPAGVFYMVSSSQTCLGFAGNDKTSDITIIGNTQQKRLEVVYDVVGGRIGFGPGGCS